MKKIAVLGTGMVGHTIASKLIRLGYEVIMGSRMSSNAVANAWASENGENAHVGNFADAATFGDIIFNCTKGQYSLEAIRMAGPENFYGKTVIDVANPLDFSNPASPTLIPHLSNTTSLGEELQRLIPKANLVKTLNMVNYEVMVNADRNGGSPIMFICGNNAAAKKEVTQILQQFGWTEIIDFGDISSARGMEMLLPLWLRTWMATGISPLKP